MTRYLLLVLLAGCSTAPSREAATVREADARMVEGCELLATVGGSSAWAGAGGGERGMARSRNEAREEAAQLGATHIVWLNSDSGWAGSHSSGTAYRCGTR